MSLGDGMMSRVERATVEIFNDKDGYARSVRVNGVDMGRVVRAEVYTHAGEPTTVTIELYPASVVVAFLDGAA